MWMCRADKPQRQARLWRSPGTAGKVLARFLHAYRRLHSRTFRGVSISGFGGYTYGKTIFTRPELGYSKDIFESKGIFVGAGAGVPALRGQFSGSLAIAGMKGNQKDDNGFDIKADTTIGFSLGGAYTYKLSQALGVTADLRYQQYKYDFGTEIAGYTVTEKITSLGVRLGYQF